jgi:hypothetical protein
MEPALHCDEVTVAIGGLPQESDPPKSTDEVAAINR